MKQENQMMILNNNVRTTQDQQNIIQVQKEDKKVSIIEKQRKRISKKYQLKNQNKPVGFLIIPKQLGVIGIQVYADLLITLECTIKLCSTLSHVSFGNQQMIGESVEYMKELNCFNIKQKVNKQIPFCGIDEAIKISDKMQGGKFLKEILQNLNQKFSQYSEFFKITQHSFKRNEDELNQFISQCFKYLKNLKKQSNYLINRSTISNSDNQIDKEVDNYDDSNSKANNENHICLDSSFGMYTFNIGWMNWEDNDIELVHQGYSAGYLDFLGLDQESLVALILRDKRIDLIQDKSEIIQYSAQGLLGRINGWSVQEQDSNIMTFDGFPIKIHQKSTQIQLPNEDDFNFNQKPEYIFKITEIDVGINDLQNLIAYRQQLSNNTNSLPLNTLIQRELSYKFEDVEYSVHVENLFNKYYESNLVALKKLEQEKNAQIRRCKIKAPKQGEHFKQIHIVNS